MKLRFAKLLWFIFKLSNKYDLAALACISSSFSTVIHLMYQINYNCFNEPFAVLLCSYLYLDMHGLVFETSIWLLAESTRYYMGENPYSKLQLEKIIHDFCGFAMQKHSINGLFIFLNCNQLVFKIINYSLKIFIECLEIENLFANLTLENTWEYFQDRICRIKRLASISYRYKYNNLTFPL